MSLHPRTWILVANSARAQTYAWVDADMPPVPLDGFAFTHDHARARDLLADRPGRVYKSVGNTRHAHEPRNDPVRQAEHAFATTVADALDTALAGHAFDRLIVLAGPTMLGDLRAAFSNPLRAAVHVERAKDLTHATLPDLHHAILAEDLLHTPVVPEA